MRKRKAAVLYPSLNYLGGAARVCLSFVKVLSRAGFEVTLFTVDRTDWSLVRRVFGEFGDLRFKERFIISRFPGSFNAMLRNIFLALFYLLEVLAVRFLLSFDIVLVVGGELIDCIGDIVYVNAIPFRLTHLFPHVRLGSAAWRCYSRLYNIFLRLLGKADSRGLLITNSYFLREIVLSWLGRDSIVIHPPVDTNRFMVSEEDGQRINMVITVSRIHPGKSLNVILEIAKRIDGAIFLIIGLSSGRLKETLNDLNVTIKKMNLNNKVSILVNESPSKLLESLSRAKVLLHTQPSEAFGMAVVEAMAAGCVPVVPNNGGPWIDILDQKQGVYGFSYRSVDEAADIIRALLNNENLRQKVANRARARALTFDKSIFEEKILRLVRKATN